MKPGLIGGQTGFIGIGTHIVGAGVTVGTSDDGVRHGGQMRIDSAEAIQQIKETGVQFLTRRQALEMPSANASVTVPDLFLLLYEAPRHTNVLSPQTHSRFLHTL